MAKTIEIDCVYDKGTSAEYQTCVHVSAYPDVADMDVVDPDEKVTDLETLKIEFDYPLTVPAIINFERTGGFTRLELFEAIYFGYKYIYDTEDGESGDPGMMPGSLNRAPSEGPFGIWGHVMEDLVIEDVIIHNNGKVELDIGS